MSPVFLNSILCLWNEPTDPFTSRIRHSGTTCPHIWPQNWWSSPAKMITRKKKLQKIKYNIWNWSSSQQLPFTSAQWEEWTFRYWGLWRGNHCCLLFLSPLSLCSSDLLVYPSCAQLYIQRFRPLTSSYHIDSERKPYKRKPEGEESLNDRRKENMMSLHPLPIPIIFPSAKIFTTGIKSSPPLTK